jgi:hypothetical protein
MGYGAMVLRHAMMLGYVNLAYNKYVLMDCCARMTYVTKQPNPANTEPPTALLRAILVQLINALKLLAGVNSPAEPTWIHGN